VEYFVEQIAGGNSEAKEKRFVPERRVCGLFDARLSRLFAADNTTDRVDIGSSQLPRLDDLHP